MTETVKHVEALIEKAAKAKESGDAMRFAQAAQNAAGALMALGTLEKPPAVT